MQWRPAAGGSTGSGKAVLGGGETTELVLKLDKPSSVDRIFLSEDVVHDGPW